MALEAVLKVKDCVAVKGLTLFWIRNGAGATYPVL